MSRVAPSSRYQRLSAAWAYIERVAIAASDMGRFSGVGDAAFLKLRADGATPNPTYRVYGDAIVSPFGAIGEPSPAEQPREYFGPAVCGWVRRAHVLASDGAQDVGMALRAWLERDFFLAAQERERECAQWGWSGLFEQGQLSVLAVSAVCSEFWAGWMHGGWAVQCRVWDGRAIVGKEIEKARIRHLTRDGARAPGDLSHDERRELADAIECLEKISLPLAPAELDLATPPAFDDVRKTYLHLYCAQ